MYIRKSTAQQIVETVKDVSGHDVNFIDTDGIIYASTDSARVGNFHEAGLQVVRSGEIQEAAIGDHFLGTQPGVNIPCIYHGETIAAIGITGDPEEVRRYAFLARKIVGIILREHELEERVSNQRARLNYVIRALVLGERIPPEFFLETVEPYGMDTDTRCRTVLIRMSREASADPNLGTAIQQTIQRAEAGLWTFAYPDRYVVILEKSRWEKSARYFRSLAADWPGKLRIGVGDVQTLRRANRSYEEAKIALNSPSADAAGIALFDTLDLEILLGSIPMEVRQRYGKRVASGLKEEDRALLLKYLSSGMSLKDTGEALHMHKNTVQYRLDRIARTTGYNPRRFHEAVVLYLALRLETDLAHPGIHPRELAPEEGQ